MQHLPINEVAHRLAREIACMRCYQRPAGSEALGPAVARVCQESCPLFIHLPVLIQQAARLDDTPGSYESVVKTSVCGGCELRPTSGEYCADYEARTCPVSRYSGELLGALQHVVRGLRGN